MKLYNPSVAISGIYADDDFDIDGHGIDNLDHLTGDSDYIQIGSSRATSHSLNSEDDLAIKGKFEVDGMAYFDGGATLNDSYLVGDIRITNEKKLYFLDSGGVDDGRIWEDGGNALRIASPSNVVAIQKNISQDVQVWGGSAGSGRSFKLISSTADSSNQLRNSPSIKLSSAYWNGSTSTTRVYSLHSVMDATTPKSSLVFTGPTGVDVKLEDDNGTRAIYIYVGGSLKTITEGAADSGGSGYRVLRVPN